MRNVTRKIEQYRDIINLPRPEPRCCPRMPLENLPSFVINLLINSSLQLLRHNKIT